MIWNHDFIGFYQELSTYEDKISKYQELQIFKKEQRKFVSNAILFFVTATFCLIDLEYIYTLKNIEFYL